MTLGRGSASDSALIGLLQDLLDIAALDLEQTLTGAATSVARWFNCDKADVFLYDARTSSLIALGTSDTPLGHLQRARGLDVLPVANGGRIVRVYQTGVSHHDGHVEDDAQEIRGIVHDLGVRSQVAVPISIVGTRRGVLAIVSQQPEWFQADDLRTIELVGSWVSALAHRAELVEQLRVEEQRHGRLLAADEIIMVLAHDVYNHLNPLSARLQLLRMRVAKQEPIDAGQLDKALGAVERLARLTQDLLDSTRLERGLFELHLAPADLNRVIAEVAQMCATPSCKVEVEGPQLPPFIADVGRFRQALENVVLNGVRHSRGSSVRIVLERADGREAVIKVQDDGLGIAREVQPQLFERFVAKGPERGLGLGLYLARRFALAHGGDLTLESELGHGSTFTFRLPLEGPPSHQERAAE